MLAAHRFGRPAALPMIYAALTPGSVGLGFAGVPVMRWMAAWLHHEISTTRTSPCARITSPHHVPTKLSLELGASPLYTPNFHLRLSLARSFLGMK